jgi:exopolysaccharide production protein ExoZ
MRTEVQSIQVLRGVAAVSVAFYHTHLILMQYGEVDLLGWIALHGKAGVNIFFTLSGFIILKAHWKQIGQPSEIPNYFYRRLVRLYPLYWLLTLAFVAASLIGLGRPDFSWSPLNMLSSLALYEFGVDASPPLKVAWTLFYEVKFYLAFILLMVSPVLGIAAFAIWSIAVLYSTVTTGAVDAGWLSPWMLYFIVGMLVYVASERLPRWAAWPSASLTLLLVAIYAVRPDLYITSGGGNILPSLLWLLPTCAFGLLAVVLAEPAGVKRRGLWSVLGDASYSIYLVHSAVISVFAIIGLKFGLYDFGGAYPLFAAAFVASIVGGYVVHLTLEKPMLYALRRRSVRATASLHPAQ